MFVCLRVIACEFSRAYVRACVYVCLLNKSADCWRKVDASVCAGEKCCMLEKSGCESGAS